MKKIFLVLNLFLAVHCVSFSQPNGYDIQFSIRGWSDTTAFLGYYNGESTFVKDTADVNHKGEFRFSGNGQLAQGIYFLATGSPKPTRIFEIVVGQTQKFALATDTIDYIKHMRVLGDIDNKLFFENMLFNADRHKEAEPFIKVVQDSTRAGEKKAAARKQLSAINEKVLAHQDKIIGQHPETLTARMLKASRPIQVPDPPKRNDGAIDSTFQLRWYRQHFFDNFDLADEALLRMPRPVYKEKINEYLDRLWAPQADTLIKAVDIMLSKAKPNEETYKNAVFQLVLKFQSPEIMGLDEVFVHINDKYFVTGEMDYWANAQMKKNISQHAERLRKSLVGGKGGNLIMLDVNLKPKALYDIRNKYTILYIFDPDCGHCREETPKLVDFYNQKKFDVQVYAVCADSSMVKMKDYIREMGMKWITVNGPRSYVGPYQDFYDAPTTPTLYVMDREKKIIAKKIPVEKLEEFLRHYEKLKAG